MWVTRQRGFTLIEILISITLVALLSGGVVSMIGGGSGQRSRDARRRADLEKVASALEAYRYDNGTYPDCSSGTSCAVSTTGLVGPVAFSTYMSSAPIDPRNPSRLYRYWPRSSSNGACDAGGTRCVRYSLCAALERVTGADSACSGAGSCGSGLNCSGSVVNP